MGFQDPPVREATVDSCLIARKMSSEEVEIMVHGPPREDLIRTAVTFLSNPNVQRSPLDQREAFLRKKGLTADEIRLAVERSGGGAAGGQLAVAGHLLQAPPSQAVAPLTLPWLQRLRDVLHTVALVVGSLYGLHYLYKRFIAPFLFGKKKRPKTVEERLEELSKTMTDSFAGVKGDLERMQGDVERVCSVGTEQGTAGQQMADLRTELSTVKGILLSRHQFPSVNLTGSSIPAWQISASSHVKDKDGECDDAEHTSGSSETEIVNNPNSNGGSQGSDSSLEMIKEVDA